MLKALRKKGKKGDSALFLNDNVPSVWKRRKNRALSPFLKGQVILEFTFCMIVVLLMIYGVAKVFIWTGRDIAERQIAHENVLTSGGSPQQQIDPYFYTPVTMNAIWNGD